MDIEKYLRGNIGYVAIGTGRYQPGTRVSFRGLERLGAKKFELHVFDDKGIPRKVNLHDDLSGVEIRVNVLYEEVTGKPLTVKFKVAK